MESHGLVQLTSTITPNSRLLSSVETVDIYYARAAL